MARRDGITAAAARNQLAKDQINDEQLFRIC